MPTMSEHDLAHRGAVWLATGLGVGLVTAAPGTIGGLWGLPLIWALGYWEPAVQQTAIVALVFAAVAICTLAARSLGDEKDPQAIVLDEIVALPIAFWGIDERSLAVWAAGFLLFRLFDITKPFPVHQAERLPAGWGIVADDCVAAVYACLALHGLLWLDRALNLAWLSAAA
jgi:phosphatidylglycerophosphatase A